MPLLLKKTVQDSPGGLHKTLATDREKQMFEYTFADIQAQLDTLPVLFRLWFAWLGLVILILPLFFLKHRQGRVAALCAAAFIPLLLVALHLTGISFFISFLHLALWLPLLVYLARELRTKRIKPTSPIGMWACLALATLVVSLVFDVRDAARWLAGERGILDPQPGIVLPWFTVPTMATALVLAWWTSFGARLGHRQDQKLP